MHRLPVMNEEQRVYGELYNSGEFINEHKRLKIVRRRHLTTLDANSRRSSPP
jgi:hypothetical protein